MRCEPPRGSWANPWHVLNYYHLHLWLYLSRLEVPPSHERWMRRLDKIFLDNIRPSYSCEWEDYEKVMRTLWGVRPFGLIWRWNWGGYPGSVPCCPLDKIFKKIAVRGESPNIFNFLLQKYVKTSHFYTCRVCLALYGHCAPRQCRFGVHVCLAYI